MLHSTVKIQFPQNDKVEKIFDIIRALPAAQALHVAHQMDLFERIAKKQSMSLQNIMKDLQIEARPAQALLSICVSLELVKLNDQNEFQLTDISKNYLLKESPFYVGGVLDLTLMNSEVYSFKSLHEALLKNSSQVYQGKELFQTNEEQAELSKIFTRCMHGKSMALAGFWPSKIDLSKNHSFLDVGGGSGAHSIGAITHWPNLQGIVYDRPAVCEVAEENIEQLDLNDRIKTCIGDMWKDPFPLADVHFYCDIFHDWSIEQCEFLIQKSHTELKAKGRIVILEMLFNEKKTGPLSVAAYNVMMLLWTQGQQFSGHELVTLLKANNFTEVEIIPTSYGDWGIVTGIKR